MAVSTTTVMGFIGTGVMGKSMASHIQAAGYPLHVYNRSKSKTDELVQKGAAWQPSPAEIAKHADVIITIVGFPNDVEEVYLGAEGLVKNAKRGAILIDMTTSKPDLAEKIHRTAKEKGIAVLDAPVSGGDRGAREAKLSIMVGGDRETFDAVKPMFDTMGSAVYQGPAGSGQKTKMANQIAIAAGMLGVCEAMAYCVKSGLDPKTVLQSIGGGAAGSWSLSNLAPRMIDGNFDPGFYVKHFIKDMRIAVDSSESVALEAPGLKLALELYEKLAAKGHEDLGTQSLYKLYVNGK